MVPVLFFGCCWSGTQKGHLWAIFLVAQEKQPWNSQRIPLNLAMKECLLPRQSLGSGTHQGWPHSLLPSSPQVMQPPRKLSQPRASVARKSVACRPLLQPQMPCWLEPQSCVGTSPASLSPSPQTPGMWLFLAPGPESAPRNPLFSQEGSEGERQAHVMLKGIA